MTVLQIKFENSLNIRFYKYLRHHIRHVFNSISVIATHGISVIARYPREDVEKEFELRHRAAIVESGKRLESKNDK